MTVTEAKAKALKMMTDHIPGSWLYETGQEMSDKATRLHDRLTIALLEAYEEGSKTHTITVEHATVKSTREGLAIMPKVVGSAVEHGVKVQTPSSAPAPVEQTAAQSP